MTMLGADPDELDRLAADIEHFAERLHGHGATLHAQLHSTSWIGHIADEFREEWDRIHHVAIVGAGSAFQAVVNAIRRQAEAQRKASAPDIHPAGVIPGLAQAVGDLPKRIERISDTSAEPPYAGDAQELERFNAAYKQNPVPDYLTPFAWGWCTSWAAFRRHELGLTQPPHDGENDGWHMATNLGLSPDGKPHAGALASLGGPKPADQNHVMVVEGVSEDGKTLTVSEMNYDYPESGGPPTGHVTSDAKLVLDADGKSWDHYVQGKLYAKGLSITFSNVDKA